MSERPDVVPPRGSTIVSMAERRRSTRPALRPVAATVLAVALLMSSLRPMWSVAAGFGVHSGSPQQAPAVPRSPMPTGSPVATIVLDAGHGGSEAGATGPGGTVEKNLTLDVAGRVKTALEARPGFRVILTRSDDRDLSLDDRAAVANNNRADLFISLHADASLVPTVAGTSIYTAEFSQAELAGTRLIPERVPVVGGGLRDIELVPWSLAQLRFLSQSSVAARFLEERLKDVLQLPPTIASAPFLVLRSANTPAVLIEMGFLSNADQETALTGTEFKTAVATAITGTAERFRDYLNGRVDP